jgi:putative toxin-antitoxin system antitoxin component (TIGR02293 family)
MGWNEDSGIAEIYRNRSVSDRGRALARSHFGPGWSNCPDGIILLPNGQEAATASYPDVLKVAATLGGAKILREKVSTVADLERAVGNGLPFAALKHVVRHFPDRQKTRVQQIVMPRSTLQRREGEGRLRPAESERLERIARMATLAEHVWESAEEAQRFLTSPHPMLGNQAPLDLAASDLGTRRVETLLWKLEHSLPV